MQKQLYAKQSDTLLISQKTLHLHDYPSSHFIFVGPFPISLLEVKSLTKMKSPKFHLLWRTDSLYAKD